jgi:hypothetical protein
LESFKTEDEIENRYRVQNDMETLLSKFRMRLQNILISHDVSMDEIIVTGSVIDLEGI